MGSLDERRHWTVILCCVNKIDRNIVLGTKLNAMVATGLGHFRTALALQMGLDGCDLFGVNVSLDIAMQRTGSG